MVFIILLTLSRPALRWLMTETSSLSRKPSLTMPTITVCSPPLHCRMDLWCLVLFYCVDSIYLHSIYTQRHATLITRQVLLFFYALIQTRIIFYHFAIFLILKVFQNIAAFCGSPSKCQSEGYAVLYCICILLHEDSGFFFLL